MTFSILSGKSKVPKSKPATLKDLLPARPLQPPSLPLFPCSGARPAPQPPSMLCRHQQPTALQGHHDKASALQLQRLATQRKTQWYDDVKPQRRLT